jgi:hypothetical protein
MIKDPNRLVEGVTSFARGANSSIDPALLPENQFAWGTNVQIRDGYPKTRPGFKFVKSLPNGVIQGASYYKNQNNEDIMVMVNGRLYSTSPKDSTASVVDMTPAGETNNFVSRKATMVCANNYLIVQDGTSPAIVFTGSNCYRSTGILSEVEPVVLSCTIGANNTRVNVSSTAGLFPGMLLKALRGIPENTVIVSVDSDTEITLNNECSITALAEINFYSPGPLYMDVSIPVGQYMAYGNGRLWIASGNQLYAGDLSGSYEGAEIRFSETQYLTGGGSFTFNAPITGLSFLPGPDTSTGQGDLIVCTKTDIHCIRASIFDRTLWQKTEGMQRRVFVGRGAESHDSFVTIGNDLYFRSLDGIRSLLYTISFGKRSALSFADSLEATRVVLADTERWLTYTPSILFDSRVLFGAAPKVQLTDGIAGQNYNIVFTKLISKDFNVGVTDTDSIPAYDGEWTGLQVCKLVEGIFDSERRGFAIVCGSDGNNALYELQLDAYFDTTPDGEGGVLDIPIECSVEYRRLDFGLPFEVKELLRADIIFSEIYGNVSWTLEHAPDFFPSFYFIQSGDISFDTQTETLTTQAPPDLAFGYKAIRTVKPGDECITGSSRRSRIAYMFQPKVSWTGYAKLAALRLHALRKDVSDLGEC